MSAHSFHIRLSSMRVSPTSNTIHRTRGRRSATSGAGRRFGGRQAGEPAGPSGRARSSGPAASDRSSPSSSMSVSACCRATTASSRWSSRWSDATRSRGKPLWAKPRTSPSRRRREVLLGQGEPVLGRDEGLQPGPGHRILGVGDEHAERLDRARAPPDRGAGGAGRGRIARRPRRSSSWPRGRRRRPRRPSCRRGRRSRRRGNGPSRRRGRSAGAGRGPSRPGAGRAGP